VLARAHSETAGFTSKTLSSRRLVFLGDISKLGQ
jgi:hypothetical protein